MTLNFNLYEIIFLTITLNSIGHPKWNQQETQSLQIGPCQNNRHPLSFSSNKKPTVMAWI